MFSPLFVFSYYAESKFRQDPIRGLARQTGTFAVFRAFLRRRFRLDMRLRRFI
jgi:hypothetical protein